jgi:hypothetical protein
MQEYVNGEDLDGNGSIFGKDFVIDPDDPDCPRIILNLYTQPSFHPEDYTNMSWSAYLATLP